MTVAVTRKELGAAELRRGGGRGPAARAAGLDRQTLRDWVRRYNAGGLAGLHDRRRPGPRPRLTPGQEAELEAVSDRGPDPERDGVVRWRRIDLRALIETRFGVRLHERTVGKLLRRLGFTRLSVRPKHPEADGAAQAAFRQASPSW